MPDAAIAFILVRDKDTGVTKYIPESKYDAQSDLWAKVGRKVVIADQAPTVDPTASASTGEKKSGQQAASTKEN